MKSFIKFITIFLSFFMLFSCSSKENIWWDYYKDNKGVYIKIQNFIEWPIIPEYKVIAWADSKTFKALSEYMWKDKNNIFRFWWKMDNFDVNTFDTFEDSYYFKDKNNIYYITPFDDIVILKGADVNSFEYLSQMYDKGNYYKDNYAKDKNNVYYDGKIMEADPDTFEVTWKGTAKDKDYSYLDWSVVK